MFSTHARCDRCELCLVVDNEDELLDAGWVILRCGVESFDFCSGVCLVRWADGRELPVAAAASEDEVEEDGDEGAEAA